MYTNNMPVRRAQTSEQRRAAEFKQGKAEVRDSLIDVIAGIVLLVVGVVATVEVVTIMVTN